jgi:peptidoglycan-associated lipoprotein
MRAAPFTWEQGLGMRTVIIGVALVAATGLAGCETTKRFMHRDELVATPQVCAPKRFEVYFADGQARLTEPARQAIGMTASQLNGCAIRRVQVTGLADPRGGEEANLSLSQRRARAVAEALAAAGWPAPAFDVEAAGEAGATTGSGAVEPLRRRTEVIVDAAPR